MRPDDVVASPELALVDPELAAWLRARAPERIAPRYRPVVRELTTLSPPSPPSLSSRVHGAEWYVRSRRSIALVGGIVVISVLGFGGLSAQDEPRPVSAPPAPSQQAPAPRAPATGRVPTDERPVEKPPPASPRRFAWAPVAGAEQYQFEIFRGSVRIFSRRASVAQMIVPARWSHGGKSQSLGPGEYRWYVWPLVSGTRAAKAVVQARLVVA